MSGVLRQGFTIWLTGMSGAGKSTLSTELVRQLAAQGIRKVEVLDGDVVRTHLSKELGFSREDRDTNIRRIGFVCNLLARNDVIAIAAAISPYRAVRDEVRRMHEGGHFLEVYLQASLEALAQRDVKGLYKKALAGEIPNFTGVSDPYEEPLRPEVIVRSGGEETVEQGAAKVLRAAELLGFLTLGAEHTGLAPALEADVVATLRAAGRNV